MLFRSRAASERQRQEEQLNLTRHKVETLRKVMEERKARREARRQAAAARGSTPTSGCYSTAWSVSEAKPETNCDKNCQEPDQQTASAEHFLSPEPEPVTA